MKITDFLRATTFEQSDLALLVLVNAAEKLDTSYQSANDELSYQNAKQSDQFALIDAAGSYLANSKLDDRLEIVDDLLQVTASRQHDYWMEKTTAYQFTEFGEGAKSVRGAGDLAIRPLLEIASRGRQKGKKAEVEFSAYSQHSRQIMRALSSILEFDIAVTEQNPWERDWQKHFDLELCFPALGYDIRNQGDITSDTLRLLGIDLNQEKRPRILAETVALAESSRRRGTRSIVVTSGAPLFRAVGNEHVIREDMVASGRLQAVIKLPNKSVLKTTSIDTYVTVFDDTDHLVSDVGFIDLTLMQSEIPERYESLMWCDLARQSEDAPPHTRVVPISEIKSQNYVLLPDRYLLRDHEKALAHLFETSNVARLDELVTLVRAFALPKQADGGIPFYEAAPGDVGEDGYLQQPRKTREVEPGSDKKVFNQALHPDDIVLSIKGNVGIVGLVPAAADGQKFWVAGQSLMILRVKNTQTISPVVLYEYLANPTVNSRLRSLASGSVFPALTMKDIKQFPVPVPSVEFQREVESEWRLRQQKFQKIRQIREEIEFDKQSVWPQSQID